MTPLAEACADLAELIPALAPALTRDNTPGGSRTMVLSTGTVVNADVLDAMLTLTKEIPATRARACQLTGEPCPRRPALTCLKALPRLHDRLEDLSQIAAARRIEADVAHWTRLVKLALGLSTPDRPVPSTHCPACGDPAPLILTGSEGFIRYDGTLHRQYACEIWCRACGATWTDLQWAHLGRILLTA